MPGKGDGTAKPLKAPKKVIFRMASSGEENSLDCWIVITGRERVRRGRSSFPSQEERRGEGFGCSPGESWPKGIQPCSGNWPQEKWKEVTGG